jgi:ABC-type Zn uptake system ZnuABC Zn-binding protein ZnuA
MKKLLLSVAALMFATLLFSLGDSNDENKKVSQDTPTVVVNDIDLAS